jgi:PhzF family phenazine biosynthesis protein
MKLSLVDAFTDTPFSGNAAAVCLLDGEREGAWMQSLARELGYSETAFLLREGARYGLRWFTPTVEVDLCGHATLASAHFLWESGVESVETPLEFATRSGILRAARRAGEIELDFPAEPAREEPAPAALAAALGVHPVWSGRNRLDFLLLLETEAEIRAIRPDFEGIRRETGGGRGVIVTSRAASPDLDFVSRYFAPAAGIDEDPVTGSTHCCLGPFWAERLGKRDLRAAQLSERGGRLSVRVGEGNRVFLGGSAVTVFRGELASQKKPVAG